MKLSIYATKDSIIGTYMKPFYEFNDAAALRNWGGAIKWQFNKDPKPELKDLELYKLGEFNDETGEIVSKVEFLTASGQFLIKEEEKTSCNITVKAEDQTESNNQNATN